MVAVINLTKVIVDTIMLKCGNKVINLSTDQNAYTDIATLTQINMDYGC